MTSAWLQTHNHSGCKPGSCELSRRKQTDLQNVGIETELQIRRSNGDNSKIIFLISQRKICCDPSLEPSRQDGSNDGSQNMFIWRNMENYL